LKEGTEISWFHHRIAQAGRDLRRSLLRPPAHSRSALRSDWAAQGIIQSSLEIVQGRRLDSPSGQPVPLPDCPHGENVLQAEPLFFQLMPVVHLLLPPCAISSVISPGVLGASARSTSAPG